MGSIPGLDDSEAARVKLDQLEKRNFALQLRCLEKSYIKNMIFLQYELCGIKVELSQKLIVSALETCMHVHVLHFLFEATNTIPQKLQQISLLVMDSLRTGILNIKKALCEHHHVYQSAFVSSVSS
jgi:hypothetical protein